jgi:hypothetical protein
MKVEIYDLECLPNFFCYTGMDKDTEEIWQIYIYNDYKQLLGLIEHLKEIDAQIGFNNINYDYPLLYYILKNYKDWEIFDIETILQLINQESNRIIEEKWTEIPYWNITIPQLDLFRIWHFDNKARYTSLKAIEIAINFENVQDIPFEANHHVEQYEIQSILDYNLNDVKATYEFYKITKGDTELELYKGKDKIQLRKDIGKHYGINCLNYNDVKIGDAINKVVYTKLTGRKTKEIKDSRTYRPRINIKDCIPNYIEFKSEYFNNFLNKLKSLSITKTKGELEFDLIYNQTKYKFAQGGLHSEDKPRHLKAENEYYLVDADVSSMYPATIINLGLYPAHLGIEWLEGYKETFHNRLEAKKNKLNSINEALKLSLNGGGFGKTNESYNWQYDPLVTLKTTIGGQLAILMLIESLEDNGIQVLSANTDGIVSKFKFPEQRDLYYSLCKEWEDKTKYQLEFKYYKQLIQTSVNDYIAEELQSGENFGKTKIKFKGDFEIDKELNKDPSMRIRAIALKEFFINNIPIEKTIKEHTNIYDFCKRFRNSKGWNTYTYYERDSKIIKEKLSKNIRYFISKKGNKITKENIEDGRKIDIEASNGVTIFNKYTKKDMKDYNIDYSYYISETRKIILSIDDGQLKLF